MKENINLKVKLTEHFTLGELIRTSVKTSDGNIPSEEHIRNLKRICAWLELLRARWNLLYGEGDDPIIINSGYRSPYVNKAVGGVDCSNHLTGCAVDIKVLGLEQMLRYATILIDISDTYNDLFDELLMEHNTMGYWLHFAVRPPMQGNRRRIKFIGV